MKESYYMTSSNSFDPRIITMQLVFGIIYAFLTLIMIVMGFSVDGTAGQASPAFFFIFALIFAFMTAKCVLIIRHYKNLMKNGVKTEAQLISCEAIRGITYLRAKVKLENTDEFEIETRLAGTTISHEITHYMQEHDIKTVPVLVVAQNTRRPRGLILIKGKQGHLDTSSFSN